MSCSHLRRKEGNVLFNNAFFISSYVVLDNVHLRDLIKFFYSNKQGFFKKRTLFNRTRHIKTIKINKKLTYLN